MIRSAINSQNNAGKLRLFLQRGFVRLGKRNTETSAKLYRSLTVTAYLNTQCGSGVEIDRYYTIDMRCAVLRCIYSLRTFTTLFRATMQCYRSSARPAVSLSI